MNPITPHLRSMTNQSRSTLRFGLVVQPGDTLAVSDDVAGQLPVEFVDTPAEEPPAPAKKAAAKKG